MAGIDSWSTTAATNATADGGAINWAEGMNPSAVNNAARQNMADVRAAFNDLAWFQYGTGDQGSGNLAVPCVYSSATAFTVTGADVTAIYHANRRVRAVGSGTGTIYGAISSSSYNGGNSTTTVNVTWDSGSLSNETLTISLSQTPVTGKPLHTNALGDFGAGTWVPTITFATPGDLSVSYANHTGYYIQIGPLVQLSFSISFTPTFTTAAGDFRITSIPVTIDTNYPMAGSTVHGNSLTYPSGVTNVEWQPVTSAALELWGYGSGVAGISDVSKRFSVTQFPSGTAQTVAGCIIYKH